MAEATPAGRLRQANSTLDHAIQLYIAEVHDIHATLDATGVPRTADGLPLSMAQRVAEQAAMLRIALARR